MSEIFKSPQHVIHEPKRPDEGEKGKIRVMVELEWRGRNYVRCADKKFLGGVWLDPAQKPSWQAQSIESSSDEEETLTFWALDLKGFPTEEAAKAAVEEAVRKALGGEDGQT